MMRVALVVAGPYPALRGSQVLVGHLAHGLGERGHAVRLVTYGDRLAERPGLHAARIALDALLTLRLWRVVRREAIDVIHAHNYEAAIAGLIVARATGRPLVYHGHCALAEELPTYVQRRALHRAVARIGRFLDDNLPRRADFCIAVTDELEDVLRRSGVTDAALACIPPASAPHELPPGPVATSDASGLVCYAGNLDGYQNLGFLLESFRRVRAVEPQARLVLVTHEGGRVEARRLAASGPDAGVEVVAVRSYGEVRRLLDAADVAVSPRTERCGFPMKLLNYMAAGKAIVAASGSAKGIRDGVTGRIVADGDAQAFAGAIVDLLRDADARRRLGTAARAAVEDPAAWEQVLDRIEGIYRRVLGRNHPRLVPLAVAE
jgi:glycosyltransferase involved in cell wall biosynthesis